MKVKIYKLTEPRTEKVRYIGITVQRLCKRLCGHVHHAKHNNSNMDKWIKELLLLKLRPIISLIEEVEKELWQQREKYWIKYYRKQYPDLTNMAQGGNGSPGLVWKEESIQSLSESHSKAVYALSFDHKVVKKYPSCKDAAKQLGYAASNISSAARSKGTKSVGGYIWIYLSDYEDWIKEKRPNYKRDQSYKEVPVYQYTKEGILIKRWDSTKQASQVLSLRYQSITRAKFGGRSTYAGFIWKSV